MLTKIGATNFIIKPIARICILAMAFLCAFTVNVNAETYTYNICKSGCEYSDLATIQGSISNLPSNSEIVINFKDTETYNESFEIYYDESVSNMSITINGNNATVNTDGYFVLTRFNNIKIVDLNISANAFGLEGYINYDSTNNIYIDYNNNHIEINNSKIIAKQMFEIAFGKANITNSNIDMGQENNQHIYVLTDTFFKNTMINGWGFYVGTMAGRNLYDTNLHIPLKDFSKEIIRVYVDNELNDLSDDQIEEIQKKTMLMEWPIGEQFASAGITKTNNVYLYQDIEKTIKDSVKISEYENEFVNTYENSYGYDDIKDNPVEWKSENDSIAKVENGTIIPVSAGKVDIVGTRNNDIYTIHLTVEKESLPEKIDKMTIKVPITGSRLKLWIILVSFVLLAIMGICVRMLIKKKK